MTKILVVEDEAAMRLALSGLLKKEGYEITLASSAREGLDAIEDGAFDLVLTDLNLGDGSGADLVGRFGAAKVVAMTGRSEADHEGARFDGWLTKPVSVDRLTKTLQSMLPA